MFVTLSSDPQIDKAKPIPKLSANTKGAKTSILNRNTKEQIKGYCKLARQKNRNLLYSRRPKFTNLNMEILD